MHKRKKKIKSKKSGDPLGLLVLFSSCLFSEKIKKKQCKESTWSSIGFSCLFFLSPPSWVVGIWQKFHVSDQCFRFRCSSFLHFPAKSRSLLSYITVFFVFFSPMSFIYFYFLFFSFQMLRMMV